MKIDIDELKKGLTQGTTVGEKKRILGQITVLGMCCHIINIENRYLVFAYSDSIANGIQHERAFFVTNYDQD